MAFPPAPAFPQEKDQKNGEKPAGIQGTWIEVSKEGQGIRVANAPVTASAPECTGGGALDLAIF